MAGRMFEGTDDEAGTMAAVDRIKKINTEKAKTAAGYVGNVAGAAACSPGGFRSAAACAAKGGDIASEAMGAARGNKGDAQKLVKSAVVLSAIDGDEDEDVAKVAKAAKVIT